MREDLIVSVPCLDVRVCDTGFLYYGLSILEVFVIIYRHINNDAYDSAAFGSKFLRQFLEFRHFFMHGPQ